MDRMCRSGWQQYSFVQPLLPSRLILCRTKCKYDYGFHERPWLASVSAKSKRTPTPPATLAWIQCSLLLFATGYMWPETNSDMIRDDAEIPQTCRGGPFPAHPSFPASRHAYNSFLRDRHDRAQAWLCDFCTPLVPASSQSAYGLAHPPATSTHSVKQLPSLPSTSTMSVSQRQRQPTPFSFGGSQCSQ